MRQRGQNVMKGIMVLGTLSIVLALGILLGHIGLSPIDTAEAASPT